MACDCNRGLYYYRAHGIEPDKELPCGHVEYTVVDVHDEEGNKSEEMVKFMEWEKDRLEEDLG